MKNKQRLQLFDPNQVRLIQSRAKVMDRNVTLGEILCGYTFVEGATVVTLSRDLRHIVYNPAYVAESSIEELVIALERIAGRSPTSG